MQTNQTGNKAIKKKAAEVVTGLHILGQIRTVNESKMHSVEKFKTFLDDLIKNMQIHELGAYYHHFDEGGFTGVISLTESHIAIHTWPELQYITLDVFLCNYSKNNEAACRRLFSGICEYFSPLAVEKKEIYR